MLKQRLDRAKKHVSENRNFYIGAGIVLITSMVIIRSGSKAKVSKVHPYVTQFLKNHPQHAGTKLRYSVVAKGQHLISMPMELIGQYKIGEKYDVVPTSSPVIYGPSLIIANDLGKHLAVFPLPKGKL